MSIIFSKQGNRTDVSLLQIYRPSMVFENVSDAKYCAVCSCVCSNDTFSKSCLLFSQSESPEEEELRSTLNSLSAELHKLDDIHWICPLMQCSEEVGADVCLCQRGTLVLSRSNKRPSVSSVAKA